MECSGFDTAKREKAAVQKKQTLNKAFNRMNKLS